MVNTALDSSDVSQGRSADAAFAPPSGTRIYGFRSLQLCTGVAGLYVNLTNYTPIGNMKGGIIQACIRKFTENDYYSPFLFFATSADGASEGYMLGLSQGYPHHVVLSRGLLQAGLTAELTENLGESDEGFSDNNWHHLYMRVLVNDHGDVEIKAQWDTNIPIVPAAPAWAAIPGISEYVDDQLGILKGAPGLTGDFYAGIAHHNNGYSGRISAFDYVVVRRQTAP